MVCRPNWCHKNFGKMPDVRKLLVQEGICWSVAWNGSGSALASSGQDRKIYISALSEAGEFIPRVSWVSRDIHNRTVRRVSWRPDGKAIAAVSFDSTISVWRVHDDFSLELITKLSGQENEVKGVCFSPCGEMLATSSRDKSIWIYDVSILLNATGAVAADEIECLSVLSGHSQDVKSVKFHPCDSHMMVSVSYDDTVKIWRSTCADDWELSETLRGHSGTVWDVAFEPNRGSEFATVSADGSMRIWTSNRARTYSSIPTGSLYLLTRPFKGINHGNPLETVSNAIGWSCQTIQLTSSLIESVPPAPVYAVDWSMTTGLIATACGDNTVKVFARRGLSTFPVTTVKMEAEPNSVSFHPNGTDLAVGLDNGAVCMFSISKEFLE